MKHMKQLISIIGAVSVAVALSPAHEGEKHAGHGGKAGAAATPAETVTVTGEVLDMACYIDHGATGSDHAGCAQTCIESGLPVGIKGNDGKTYILIGEHKPLNKQLAPLAAKTITVRGKVTSRDGFNMIENAEIVSK